MERKTRRTMIGVLRECWKVSWMEKGLEEDPDFDGWTILDKVIYMDSFCEMLMLNAIAV